MRLTTVFSATNDNPAYYLFIPKQIVFWKHFGIKFICVFVGTSLPNELLPYKDNIILWNNKFNLNTAYIGQNLRIFYPALLDLPDDELVMITDMDMLPMNDTYYKSGLENYTIDDFIYYRHIDGNQIYMCYNAAHPKTWSKVFDITTPDDIDCALLTNYNSGYNGIPGSTGWYTDQEILYRHLHNYPHLKVLNRPIRRLEMWDYKVFQERNYTNFISNYDDGHFHRNYKNNEKYILDAEKQLRS
jgi:hypothetical protein